MSNEKIENITGQAQRVFRDVAILRSIGHDIRALAAIIQADVTIDTPLVDYPEALRKRLEAIAELADTITADRDSINTRFEQCTQNISELSTGIQVVEKAHRSDIDKLRHRLDTVESNCDDKDDEQLRRIEQLEQLVTAARQTIDSLTETVPELRDLHQSDIAAHKVRLDTIEQHTADITATLQSISGCVDRLDAFADSTATWIQHATETMATKEAFEEVSGQVAGHGEIISSLTRQFAAHGAYFSAEVNKLVTNSFYANTGYILLNRNYPIKAHVRGNNAVYGIAVFDAQKTFLKGIALNDVAAFVDIEMAADDIPEGAVYFMCSSYALAEPPAYSNGGSLEAASNAAADAITAAKLALADVLEQVAGHSDIISSLTRQFNMQGYYFNVANKAVIPNKEYNCTGYLPLNRNCPIQLHGMGTAAVYGIAVFDAQKTFIKGIAYENGTKFVDIEMAADDIPEGAVYFMCSSYALAEPPAYSNGGSLEATGNAAADAVTAAKLALLIPECTFNASTGLFGLNGLGLTADDFLRILQYGSYESCCNIFGASAFSFNNLVPQIRTTLPTIPGRSDDNSLPLPRLGWLPRALEVIHFCIDNPSVSAPACLTLNSSISIYSDKLRAILDPIKITASLTIGSTNQQYAPNLETLRLIIAGSFNLNIPGLAKLNLGSFLYLVQNAANTSAITVTVHPYPYAKLMSMRLIDKDGVYDEDQCIKSTTIGNTEGYPQEDEPLAPGDYVLMYGNPKDANKPYYFVGIVTTIAALSQKPVIKTLYGVQASFDPSTYDRAAWEQVRTEATAKKITFATTE